MDHTKFNPMQVELRDLKLDFTRVGAADPYSDEEEPIASSIKSLIFQRDLNACQFCGFWALKYQQIVSMDSSTDMDSVLTACIFCAQCFEPQLTSQRSSGILVHLPEIEQRTLHYIARDMHLARRTQHSSREGALALRNTILSRKDLVELEFGTADYYQLAEWCRNSLDLRIKLRRNIGDLRLFPLDKRIIVDEDLEYDQLPQILAHWRSRNGPYSTYPGTFVAPWLELGLKLLDITI